MEVSKEDGKEKYVDDSVKNRFNPLSGDLYGDDARRWQEEEEGRMQVAEAIEQVAVAMKKVAEEEAAAGEAEDKTAAGEEEVGMDEVVYG